jgi:hypothetical protein
MQIENLPKEKELDSKEMKEVRGGDNGNSAASTVLQELGIAAPVGVSYGAGSAGNTFVHVDGSQSGNVSNDQTSGDKFKAFLGEIKGA